MKNFLLFIIIICFIGCGENNNTVAPLVNSEQEESDTLDAVFGKVWLGDEYTWSSGIEDSLDDHSGVIVTLKGKNTLYRDTTGTDGWFEFVGAKPGVYSIELFKEGYVKAAEPNLQYVGNGRYKIGGWFLRTLQKKSFLYGSLGVSGQYISNANDKSGATVSVKGTNLSGVTDKNGTWHIKGMQEGEFTLNAEKAGYEFYADSKLTSYFRHDTVNGSKFFFPFSMSLIETPTVGISLSQPGIIQSGDTTFLQIPFNFINLPNGNQVRVQLFFGEDNVSMSNFKEQPNETYEVKIINAKYVVNISENNLGGIGLKRYFPAGTQVYIRAYVVNPGGGIFNDPVTKQKIPVGYGQPSQIVSFIMP